MSVFVHAQGIKTVHAHNEVEWDFWFVNFFVVKSCSETGFLHTTTLLRHQGSQKN